MKPLRTVPASSEVLLLLILFSIWITPNWGAEPSKLPKTLHETKKIAGHDLDVLSIAFSPDGGKLASGGVDGTVRIWDVASGKELLKLKAPEEVYGVSFAPDGKTVAGVGKGNAFEMCLWDVATGKPMWFVQDPGVVTGLAFSPDGKSLAVAKFQTGVSLLDAGTGKEIRALHSQAPAFTSVAFSPDGKKLAATGQFSWQKFDVSLWELNTGKVLMETEAYGHTLAYAPDGASLAIGGASGAIALINLNTRKDLFMHKERGRSVANDDEVFSVLFSRDGKLLAAGGRDEIIRIWQIASEREVARLVGHNGRVNAMALSPDGKWLASAGQDKAIHLWEMTSVLSDTSGKH